jgi:hypothetical protein
MVEFKLFHVKRLLKLAKFLRTRVKKQNFDMCTWGSNERNCGTKACVLGWAGLMPEFRKRGLKTVPLNYWSFDGSSLEIRYKNLVDGNAGQVFFGLTETERAWMFNYSGYKNSEVHDPKKVAKKIRQLALRKLKVLRREKREKARN